MSSGLPVQPKGQNVGNYLRARRKKAGLSQRELGRLLGYAGEGAVSRHEQSKTVPPLSIAITYEIIFQNHVSELYPAVTEKMKMTIEQRLLDFEKEMQGKAAKSSHAIHIDQKLAWLSERRNPKKVLDA
jgi:transcriptional regulator with XRE-family HTH domain